MSPFELEQLHVLFISIQGIQKCVFYRRTNDKAKPFQSAIQINLGSLEQIPSAAFESGSEEDLKVKLFQPVNGRITFQLPIHGGLDHALIGKMQVFFEDEKNLQDKVKLECLTRIQNCLNILGSHYGSLDSLINL